MRRFLFGYALGMFAGVLSMACGQTLSPPDLCDGGRVESLGAVSFLSAPPEGDAGFAVDPSWSGLELYARDTYPGVVDSVDVWNTDPSGAWYLAQGNVLNWAGSSPADQSVYVPLGLPSGRVAFVESQGGPLSGTVDAVRGCSP